MRRKSEKGQAILLVVAVMALFLVGALGLAIDGARLYGHRGMAQVAADAAAQAAILSIFNGTNVGANDFAATTTYTGNCTTYPDITPCRYALKNGFGTSSDLVEIDVPTATAAGIDPASLSTVDPVNLIRVTITRHVNNGMIRMLGAANTTDVKAVAVAAIVAVEAATPILITHPTLSQSLSTNGSTSITICGGPSKSIQVNSISTTALNAGGAIHLEHAGPADTGTCSTGTGADLGVFGGPTTVPGSVTLGTTGNYISPASRVRDPLAFLAAPAVPTTVAPLPFVVHNSDSPNYGCSIDAEPSGCTVLGPGLWAGGLNATGNKINGITYGTSWIIFKPGLYYMLGGGFTMKNVNGGGGGTTFEAMCSTCTADADTGTGMVVYDTGPTGSLLNSNPSGGFTIDTGVQATLRGATLTTVNGAGQTVPAAPYYGLLFWEDSTANSHTGSSAHGLGQGNGCFTLIGTIYATNTLATMTSDASHYQSVTYNGNPCSTTVQQGDIVVSALQIVGSTQIQMNLVPWGFLIIRQVSLVR
jgi:hypothetical protein